jgi:uncharacterized HAD superfamily protein
MLTEFFPGIFTSIEYTSTYAGRSRSKGDVCEQIGADLLIEDHLGHAKEVAERGIEVLLFGSYPWNQAKKLPKSIRRVRDWAEVEQLLL